MKPQQQADLNCTKRSSYQTWLQEKSQEIQSAIYNAALNWLNQIASENGHDTVTHLVENKQDFTNIRLKGKSGKLGYKCTTDKKGNYPTLNLLVHNFKPEEDYTFSSKPIVAEMWENEKCTKSPQKTPDIDYLTRKQITAKIPLNIAHSDLKGAPCIILPITDFEGSKRGIQRIFNSGDKRYNTGFSKKGAFIAIGEWQTAEKILICEGFATGASLYIATGYPVLCALDAGNLLAVATGLKERIQDSQKVVICGDNDDKKSSNNIGLEKATYACGQTGFLLAYPEGIKGTDFNDLHVEKGLNAIKPFIDSAKPVNVDTEQAINQAKPSDKPSQRINNPSIKFWSITSKIDRNTLEEKPVVNFNLAAFIKCVNSLGFRLVRLDPENLASEPLLCFVENNIVQEVSNSCVQSVIINYVRREMAGADADLIDNVINLLIAKTKMFSTEGLWQVKPLEKPFIQDTRDTSYTPYLNGVAKTTKDGTTLIKYADLNGFVWKNRVLPRNFKVLSDSQALDSDFARFCENLCTSDNTPAGTVKFADRLTSLHCAIGYLLDCHKSQSEIRAVIFNDERITTEGNTGGSGKSLLLKSIAQMRSLCLLDGRTFDFEKTFKYQAVKAQDTVVAWDDTHRKFDFTALYSAISEGLTCERKGKDSVTYTHLKFAISTNFTVGGTNPSDMRRRLDIEISPYYGEFHKPIDDFKREFFGGWDDVEWARFDNYMLLCLQKFLQNGLIEPSQINVKLRRLIEETGKTEDFYQFCDSAIETGMLYDKKVLLEQYRLNNEDAANLRQATFTRYLQKWSGYKGYLCFESHSGAVKQIRFVKPQPMKSK